jgi:hypothetical protein
MSDPVPPGAGADEAPAAIADSPQPAPTLDGGVKEQLEAIQRAERMQREMAAQPQPQPRRSLEDQIAALPAEAKAWVRAHPDYWTDPAKNKSLSSLHGFLVDTKRLQPFSTEYFDRLEAELGLKEPAEPAPETKRAPIVQAPPRSVPYAAPVTRGAPSVSGGSVAQKVILSPEEVQMAHMAYRDLPPEKAERLYWEMKVRMVRAKANGEIQS